MSVKNKEMIALKIQDIKLMIDEELEANYKKIQELNNELKDLKKQVLSLSYELENTRKQNVLLEKTVNNGDGPIICTKYKDALEISSDARIKYLTRMDWNKETNDEILFMLEETINIQDDKATQYIIVFILGHRINQIIEKKSEVFINTLIKYLIMQKNYLSVNIDEFLYVMDFIYHHHKATSVKKAIVDNIQVIRTVLKKKNGFKEEHLLSFLRLILIFEMPYDFLGIIDDLIANDQLLTLKPANLLEISIVALLYEDNEIEDIIEYYQILEVDASRLVEINRFINGIQSFIKPIDVQLSRKKAIEYIGNLDISNTVSDIVINKLMNRYDEIEQEVSIRSKNEKLNKIEEDKKIIDRLIKNGEAVSEAFLIKNKLQRCPYDDTLLVNRTYKTVVYISIEDRKKGINPKLVNTELLHCDHCGRYYINHNLELKVNGYIKSKPTNINNPVTIADIKSSNTKDSINKLDIEVDWKAESDLKRMGYSTQVEIGRRHTILTTKAVPKLGYWYVRSFLEHQISLRINAKKDYSRAISVWQGDIKFLDQRYSKK